MIGIVDYGSGNVHAIANIYNHLSLPFIITNKPDELEKASKLILPGVGAFDETMMLLGDSGLKQCLDELVLEKKVPVIGVCVGMQIMAQSSEEGVLPGLGWIKGSIRKIDRETLTHKPYLPHMGWNDIHIKRDNPLLKDIDIQRGFYFLHSYHFAAAGEENVLATTRYGAELACVVNRENVYGVQFHPEKSHTNGLQIFKNFYYL